jgi:trimeric autotransporter adhesin
LFNIFMLTNIKTMADERNYNSDAQIFESQVVISDSTNASVSGGSLVVQGGLSTRDTFVTGHVAVNNVRLTPNLNDIIYEVQAALSNNVSEPTNIQDFKFDSSVTSSFKAMVNVNVSTGISKYAIWEINAVFKPSSNGWEMTSMFTGDITGVDFSITSAGQMRYTNSNTSGTTTIRFRATTTAPPGTSPTGSTGLINNTSGPYITDRLIFSNSPNTIANTDLEYSANVLKIGGTSRIVAENQNAFVSYSSGGAITSMGDASIAQKLIVGQRIGIAKTSPAYAMDIAGDINFTGNIYKNGGVYSGSSIWDSNGNNVFYTQGNLGIGTTSPSKTLHVAGDAIISTGLTTGNINATGITAGSIKATDISTGTLIASNGITVGNINFTGSLYQNGATYVSSQWTNGSGDFANSVFYSTGNVGIKTSTPAVELDVNGSVVISGRLTAGNIHTTNISSGTLIATTGVTAGNINFTGALYKNGELYVGSQWTSGSSGSLYYTAGSVGINNTAPIATLDVTGSGSFSQGITAASAQITNAAATTATIATLLNTNAVSTNISSATLNLSTGITAASAQITNAAATTATIATLLNTNAVSTNISSATLNLSTGITAASAQITNAAATTATIATLLNTNAISTNISSATLNLSGGITAASAQITNASISTLGSGWISSTVITGGSVSLSGSMNIGGNAVIAGDLTVAGTTTTINTNTTLVEDNLIVLNSGPSGLYDGGIMVQRTAGSFAAMFYSTGSDEFQMVQTASDPGTSPVVVESYKGLRIGSIVATHNSNTIGSLFTTGGNIGIGTTSPSATLHVIGSAIVSTSVSSGTLHSSIANITTSSIGNARITNITAGNINAQGAYVVNGEIFSATVSNMKISAITTGSIRITNENVTTSTIATLLNTNAVSTNITSATLNLSTGITTASAEITNANITTSTIATLRSTNEITTNITAATINLSTGLTSASAQITNAVTTNITSATLNLSTGITAASGRFTNLSVPYPGTILGGDSTFANVLMSTLTISGSNWANISNLTSSTSTIASLLTTNAICTNITSATLNLSTGLTSASAQITNSNVTTETIGTARITTSLVAVGNSNTVGSIFTTGGNVGMGTTAPSYALQVVGDVYASGDVISFSDARYKTSIEPLDNCIGKIQHISGISYTKLPSPMDENVNMSQRHIGLLAQEVQEQFPELVSEDPSTGIKSVSYSNMVAVLLECIKSLSAEIAELKK